LQVTVRSWNRAVGDTVTQGADLVEAKTEKITLYVTAPADGTLAEITIAAGQKARVGDVIGYVEGDG
jgi:pyruvate/2-oxoglutarate dehydrogenase complex dihydrolipoamide acyltransferase (E2) component